MKSPMSSPARIRWLALLPGLTACGLPLAGCGVAREPLMPTPILYTSGDLDPFAHLADDRQTTTEHIFYATDREPLHGRAEDPEYGNKTLHHLHLGEAVVRFGDEDLSWDGLHEASTTEARDEPIYLQLDRSRQHVRFKPVLGSPLLDVEEEAADRWFDAINAQLAQARDKEILIYVHGAKVDFQNACVVTAQIDHFAGRDFVGIAFSWPVHQTIFTYMSGEDVRRAMDSAESLCRVLELLAERTEAEHINVLAYSAGGKVAIHALGDLRRAYAEMGERELQERFRIGRVVFAAPDVLLETLVERLPEVHALASDGVVLTMTDDDVALQMGEKIMGGSARAGEDSILEDPELEEEIVALERLELIDVSASSEARGFDINGHHYWHAHPWASSDIILLVRTSLPPHERGLAPTAHPRVWALPPDYPARVREAARRSLGGTW